MRGQRPLAALALLILLGGCGRKDAPEQATVPPPAAAMDVPKTMPWAWHPLGDLAVIEGEVAEPTDLVLEGHSIRATRFAEAGPVRWELYRPPEGEVAVLRTASGRSLARFDFSTARKPALPKAPAPPHPPASPRPALPSHSAPPQPHTAPSRPLPVLISPVPSAKARMKPAPPPPTLPHRPRTPLLAPIEATPPLPEALPAWPQSHPSPFGPAPRWPGMGEALNLTRGPSGHKQMLLSFDGGSSDEVAVEILDLLKARRVHTTFFLTGTFIRHYPDIVRRMAAEGHEIGNHTMDHPHFAPGMRRDPAWTKARVQKELLDADAELARVLGRPMDPYWRAPYGEQTPEIRRWAEELGYRHVGWSEGADTLDWATTKERHLYRSGTAILKRLHQRMEHDGDGLIVLMHLGSERTEQDRPTGGLGAFMDRAQTDGWHFVNAGTFLHELGKPTWDPHQRLALLPSPPSQAAAGTR